MIHQIVPAALSYRDGVTLFCFGDLQSDAPGFDRAAWEEFKDRFKSTPNAYGLGLGDYGDFVRPSQRARILAALAHDDSTHAQVDDQVRRVQDKLLDEMQFLEGRLVGLHTGHHVWTFRDGSNSDMRIASALKAKYLGWVASTRLSLGRPTDKVNTFSYTVVSTHGSGSSRKIGGTVNWLEGNIAQSFICDHVVMGHACKSATAVAPERQIVRRHGPAGLEQQVTRCTLVGGFHRGYTDGWETSYVERAGFSPQPVMWGVIRIKLVQRKANSVAKSTLLSQTGTLGRSRHYSPALDVESFPQGPAFRPQGS